LVGDVGENKRDAVIVAEELPLPEKDLGNGMPGGAALKGFADWEEYAPGSTMDDVRLMGDSL
jgi:hypothetical protein